MVSLNSAIDTLPLPITYGGTGRNTYIALYPPSPYVVGPVNFGGYQTVQAALTAIGPGGSGQIWLLPGTYTENLVFPNGINCSIITGSDESAGSAVIVGTHTPPATGNVVTWRVAFTAGGSGHIFDSAVAGSANLTFVHNNFILNGYIFNLPNWTSAGSCVIGLMADRSSTASGIINNTAGTTFLSFENTLGVGNTFPMIASGFTLFEVSNVSCPVGLSGAGASINFYDSNFFATVTLGGATSGFFVNSYMATGATAALVYNSSANTTLSNVIIDSSNNPAIDGTSAGQLNIGSITFMNNSTIAGTVTQTNTSVFQTGTVRATGSSVNGTVNINTSGAGVTTIGTGGTGAVNIGNATGNTAVTGSLTASTGLVATTGGITATGTSNINTSGAAVTSIGTGGTGATNIGNATGNTAVTGSLTASTGLVATTGGITATGTSNINTSGAAVTSIGTGGTGATNIGNATGNTAVTGSLTASTTLTATLGNITATNGNLVAVAAGTGLTLPVGTASGGTPQIVNARVGSVTFTGVSIAAAADLTLTLTNSTITGASTRVMLTMSGSTTGSAPSIKSITPSGGSLAIVVTNGTGATTTTADITFDFIVLN